MVDGHTLAPNVLYHYTSIEAFKNIIDSKKMRATRYDQMNDTGELQLGVQNLLEAIRGHAAGNSPAWFKDWLLPEIEDFGKDALNVYVLSFSAVADSLDQWRAYSQSGGVAIGFDSKKIQEGFLIDITSKVGELPVKNPVRPTALENHLIECQYTKANGHLDHAKLRALADSFFVENSFARGCVSQEQLVRDLICLSSSTKIYQKICSIKHGAYSSEKEWRCVNYNPDRTYYPIHLSGINRFYIEMAFDPGDYIKEVWISPHGQKDVYKRVVTHYSQMYNLQFKIYMSSIPFRI